MTKVTKPSEENATPAPATATTQINGELSEADLDKVSGGPTAVENARTYHDG